MNRLDPDSGSPVPPALDPAALYSALVEADDQGDAPGLARLAWALFALASKAEEVNGSVLEALTELTAAARAAIVGDGSVASLALLRHVLAKRGWLPPRDASPLQVLAAPAGDSRWQVRQLIADGAVAIGRSAAFSVPFAVPD